MDSQLHPKDDPRTVDELINQTLMESDEDARWSLVCALHWRGSIETVHWAESLCRSACPHERCLGVDILAQLGIPERTCPDRCWKILTATLRGERDLDVIYSLLMAFSHLEDSRAVPFVVRFAGHADDDIRFAAACALSGHENDVAIRWLIQLSQDPVAWVRDWATFGLGTLIQSDTPEIRDALFARVDDVDSDTRAEALTGLVERRDPRVIPALQNALSSTCVGTLEIEAARDLAASELASYLIALRSWWDVDRELLEEAIVACSSNA